MSIKLIDVFKHKGIINFDYLDLLVEIEREYKGNRDVWEAITTAFEMIRKALKWEEVMSKKYAYIIEKLIQYFELVLEKIREKEFKLSVAEAMSEMINISNILLNIYPDWINSAKNKSDLVFVISKIYGELTLIFIQLSDINFEEMKPLQRASIDQSQARDKSMVNKLAQTNQSRITSILGRFKRSTLCTDKKFDSGNSFVMSKGMSSLSGSNQSIFSGKNSASKRQSLPQISFDKNAEINYESTSLIDNVTSDEDSFSAYILLQSYKFINVLVENM
jgi:hypothetical protein